MRQFAARLTIAAMALPLLSGCIAAAIPLAAAGVIARDQVKEAETPPDPNAPPPRPQPVDLAAITIRDSAEAAPPAAAPVVSAPAATSPVPEPAAEPAMIVPVAAAPVVPAAAATPYAALIDHVRARSALVAEGAPVISLVLENSLTLREPDYVDCGQRPPAVLIASAIGRAALRVKGTDLIAAASFAGGP